MNDIEKKIEALKKENVEKAAEILNKELEESK